MVTMLCGKDVVANATARDSLFVHLYFVPMEAFGASLAPSCAESSKDCKSENYGFMSCDAGTYGAGWQLRS